MCVMRSATPAFLTAAIESPPPTIVVPVDVGDRLGHGHRPLRERVDLEDAHRSVPHDRLRVGDQRGEYAVTVFGPMSSPMRSPMAGSSTSSDLRSATPASSFVRHDVIGRQQQLQPALRPRAR